VGTVTEQMVLMLIGHSGHMFVFLDLGRCRREQVDVHSVRSVVISAKRPQESRDVVGSVDSERMRRRYIRGAGSRRRRRPGHAVLVGRWHHLSLRSEVLV